MHENSSFTRVFLGIVVMLLVGTGVLLAGSGPTRYRIEDLGTFGGPDSCEEGVHPTLAAANGLNESGDVVGWAQRSVQRLDPDTGEPLYYPDTGHAVCATSSHAALWSNGEIIELDGLTEGSSATANNLNDHGQVVGRARTSQYADHPFLWTEEGGMIDLLEDLPSQTGTSWGINNFGEITLNADGGYFRAVNGDLRPLRFPDSPEDLQGEAWEINNDGVVAGLAYNGDGRFNAFRYDPAADIVENIHDPFFRSSRGYGVNDQGDIAVVVVAYTWHAFASVVTADGGLVVLPLGNIRYQGKLRPDLLLGGVDDVNALGDVIGSDVSVAHLGSVPWIAFDVLGDGPLEKIVLDDLLSPEDQEDWSIYWAWAINDARQLVGYAWHKGRARAFLMTPDDAASSDAAGTQAATVAFPGAGPGAAIPAEIDPATGLEGVTNFVPKGMSLNRVVGSLRPLSTIEPGAPGWPPRGAKDGEGLEAIDRKHDRVEPRRPRESHRNSIPTTRDDG